MLALFLCRIFINLLKFKKMKNVLYLVIVVIALVSCDKSPEEKAEALIAKSTKTTLFKPETYEPVVTNLDSAFAPYDSPLLFDKVHELYKKSLEFDECENKAKFAKSSMNIWKSSYMSEYAKNEYLESKDEFEEYTEKSDEIQKEMETLETEIKELLDGERQFVGFKAVHRFRAENNIGQVSFGDYLYFLDEGLTEVIAFYDTNSDEFLAVQNLIEDLVKN